MNKEELKYRVLGIVSALDIEGKMGFFQEDTFNEIFDLIDQLDEPEKVVVPSFVAEYIERAKPRHDSLYQAMEERAGEEINEWIQAFYNSDTFARAWIDGYTVEEDRYYVLSTEKRMMLVRKMDGKTITQADPFPFEELYDSEKKAHRLTEKEIKNYDPRYMAFAIPAEEVQP